MKRLDNKQCERWFKDKNYPLSAYHKPIVRVQESVAIPTDSGQRILLIRRDCEKLKGKQILLLFAGWSVWPSGEWTPLFNALNKRYGFDAPLIKQPGYLFKKTEFNAFMNFAVIGIIFLWDFYCCLDDGTVLFYSHDEYREKGKLVKQSTGTNPNK